MKTSWIPVSSARTTSVAITLNDTVEMTRTVNNTMNFNGAASDHVEHKVGFDDENAVSISRKFLMLGDSTEARVGREGVDSFVELFREGGGPCGTVAGNPVEDRQQVVFGNRKVADNVLIRHGCDAAVFASSENG